jgi:hypothetical protein
MLRADYWAAMMVLM